MNNKNRVLSFTFKAFAPLALVFLLIAKPASADIAFGGVHVSSVATPSQIWLSPAHVLFVASSGTTSNSKVSKFDDTGTLVTSSTISSAKPQGVVYSAATGLVYLAATASNVIYSYDTDLGNQTSVITSITKPVGLAVNTTGTKLYVVAGATGSNSPGTGGNISVFSTSDYSLLETIALPSQSKIGNATSLVVDADENLYIVDYRGTNIASVWGNAIVFKYTAATSTFTSFASGLVDTDNANTADSPSGIALDDVGNIYVLVRGSRAGGSGSIRKYTNDGTFIEQHRTTTDSGNVLNRPEGGIQVDANYRIYVGNTNGSKIQYYDQTIDTPTDVTIGSTDSVVSLGWGHIADSRLSSYTIRRSTVGYPSSETDGESVASGLTSSTASYEDTGLNSGTYYYSLFSKDSSNNYSPAAQATTTVTNVGPSAPTAVAAFRSGSTANLTWANPVADFGTTTVRRSTDTYPTSTSEGTLVVDNSTSTNYSDTGLEDGTYYYSVFALDPQGNASIASTASITIDVTAPTITMLGNTNIELTVGDTYTDAGATALDGIDGNVTSAITVNNTVNTSVAGIYTVTYNVQDAAGNTALTATRTITVVEPTAVTEEPTVSDEENNTLQIPQRIEKSDIRIKKQSDKYVIRWKEISTATEYSLRILNTKNKIKLLKRSVSTVNLTLTRQWLNTHLSSGQPYRIQLKACNEIGCSAWSAYKLFTWTD